jgi:hypothetical protein
LTTLDNIAPEEIIHVIPIEGAPSLNLVLKEFEEYVDEWKTLTDPILTCREHTLQLCEIDSYKLANIKHVIIGTMLSYIVNGTTFEKMKEQITFSKEKPFIEVSTELDPKYKEIITKVKEWIVLYWSIKDNVGPLY